MFSTFGYEEVIKDIYRISAPFSGGRSLGTADELRIVFSDFLENHQPYMPVNRSADVFVTDQDIEDALVEAYSFKSALDDLGQVQVIGDAYPMDQKLERVAFARDALEEFLNCDEMLAVVFDLAIHSIVIRPSTRQSGRSSYGGSSSEAIGTIWLSLGPSVTEARCH